MTLAWNQPLETALPLGDGSSPPACKRLHFGSVEGLFHDERERAARSPCRPGQDRRTARRPLAACNRLRAKRPWTGARAIRQSPDRADFDRRLLGSFLEHLGRAIYTGVYQPESPLADEHGFRKDVLAEVKELGVPIVRYPGGNLSPATTGWMASARKDERPTVLERAWNSLETNQFGTNEFIEWCTGRHGAAARIQSRHRHGGDGGGLRRVLQCRRGTKWSDLRRAHGYEQPHNVRYWCLGNEMDGPWQMGHMTAPRVRPQGARRRPADSRDRPGR